MSYREDSSRTMKTFDMRPSRVLRTIRKGGIATCIKVVSSDPRITETVAASGTDAIWVCTEHTPTNYENIENQVRAAKVFDVDLVLRCPRGSYSDHVRGLEADAAGIMVPHVMGLDDAMDVVRMTRFPPLGRRACDGGNADGLYTRMDLKRYFEQANTERFVILQIEDPEPLGELDAIAELPGVDMLFFGPLDYSSAIGASGDMWSSEVMKVGATVAQAARKAGKMAGTVAVPDRFADLCHMGYNFINIGVDVAGLAEYVDQRMDAFQQSIAGLETLR